MDEANQKLWAERAVRMVNNVFPKGDIDVNDWVRCQRYLAHAQTCAIFIEEYDLAFPKAAHLLNQTASYLQEVALYPEAEPLLQRAIAIDEKALGSDHPGLARDLNNLAELYQYQGKYEQAEPLYQRALQIVEKRLGPAHPNTVTVQENYEIFLEEKKRKN